MDDPFGINSTPAAPPVAAPSEPPPLIDSHCQKFFLKNSGVLYEDENLQIGIKMEFRERLGRIQLFYGNKSSSVDISSFKADVGRLKTHCWFFLTFHSIEGLNISTHQEAPNTITVGSQFQHIVNVETNKVSSFCLVFNKSLLGFWILPNLEYFRYLRWPAPITAHRLACLHDKIRCNCHNGCEPVLSKMARAWETRSTEPDCFQNELYKPRNR